MSQDLFEPDYPRNQIFIAFDTETTGMWAPTNRIVELSAVKFTLESQIETFDKLINPEVEIPAEVIEIHGITNEDVQNCQTIKPVLQEFIAFCGHNSILIAHNAPFDISFVGCELKRAGLEFGDNPILDTVDIFKKYYPECPSFSLLNLSRHFKIAKSQNHRALSDAVLVQKLFLEAQTKLTHINRVDDWSKYLKVYNMTESISDAAELPEKYHVISDAIDQQLPLEIDYYNPRKISNLRVIVPREVHRLGATYYIIGFCRQAGADRTFRLDRINSYRIVNEES